MSAREVLLVVHTGREDNQRTAFEVARRFTEAGFRLRVLAEEAPDLDHAWYPNTVEAGPYAAVGTELVFVLGGDGTLLRAAELARPARVPVLGVNFGRVGFLAEADSEHLAEAVQAVIDGDYQVEERMTIDVRATWNGAVLTETWALNEASVEKNSPERVIDAVIEVDGRPVLAFGCDGVLCATPTGSTAYAFSAGGPVVWPQVPAMLVVPSNAHALFAKTMVVARDSVVAVEVTPDSHPAVLCCDGRRTVELPPGSRVEVVEGECPIGLVRLRPGRFSERLIRKFDLPVQGWRGPPPA
ncbi:NAD kinase [Actinoalloteichus sp. AHMU CJ021]|uniref:NAD kinase n=1 Tax=Actinoalloteichus caeruleus DSM 43889 TaxID=1120930 RepID=A0ABT1JHC7_ACTCY|nr:NAD kinase [Actinoalloteichus caeruleus]AUS77666.1 NAD kinase [Actinoalloteichus sp. AHMU CJ021]MCP2331576.1 NAD+ kinase [Actinoalloteichus caeruleus DSM 43889]